ncbi:sulfite exporter TauE/SafE family protein [Puia dinghuensis]|uniref:Probable membrane transporter protein n=1 Tax=Puia dinghuensis TaxID=1792502 RepID=A0A8J2XRM4_9BACT|nr:sulfite exporter TauE/SafE family protein [Puia dinghuensis]GGB02758.1 UPF0721 transmembrane protein [Puia dinghuensis]
MMVGYIASLFIGVSLGLLGGGGSILTVPVLVYLFGIDPVHSTSYSLFIVGLTSLAGAVAQYRKGLVRVRIALLFAFSSVVTVFLTRKLLIPRIPERLFSIGSHTITHGMLTMLLFALLMIVAGLAMIRGRKGTTGGEGVVAVMDGGQMVAMGEMSAGQPFRMTLYAVGVGLVTGMLGAGGGFLLIPTLVLFANLPMKEAVGTSLLIIALNSLIGFSGDIGRLAIDWRLLLQITVIAAVGIILGGMLSKKMHGEKLKHLFGYLVLLMGSTIFILSFFSYA